MSGGHASSNVRKPVRVTDRLAFVDTTYTLLEVALPLVRIPVVPGRSMAMQIETAQLGKPGQRVG